MLKENENPPIIWPDEKGIEEFEGTWWVAHIKSRNEKALAWQLVTHRVQYFLPMSWKVSKNKQRTFRSLLPVFPGYLFFCGQERDRMEVLKTNRVANLIPVHSQSQLVTELKPIETVLRTGEILLPHDYLQAGQKCKVIAGPLMGTEGIVESTPKGSRLILQVEMLGQAASVEIDMDMVEKIET